MEASASRSDLIHNSTAELNPRGKFEVRRGSVARMHHCKWRQLGNLRRMASCHRVEARSDTEQARGMAVRSRRQLNVPIQPETARPISSGESS